MPDELLIKSFKDGYIPKCVYCKRSVPWKHSKSEPEFGRGRWGNGHFCSLSCVEQWTRRHFTGESDRRGLSHKKWWGE
jgi:hypothetical protein